MIAPHHTPTSYRQFLHVLCGVRILYLRGSFGTGKTALAFQIAHDLIKDFGFTNVISNVSSVWTEHLPVPLDRGRLNSVLILDEAGLFMKKQDDLEDFLAFLRKLNIVVIMPSVMPAFKLPYVITSKRLGTDLFGRPLYEYRMGYERYSFTKRVHHIYGIYDTLQMVTSAHEIGAFITQTIKDVQNGGYSEVDKREFKARNWMTEHSLNRRDEVSHPYWLNDYNPVRSFSLYEIFYPIFILIVFVVAGIYFFF